MKRSWSSWVLGLLLSATAAGQNPQGPMQTVMYFPDYVDGGGWSIQLAITNVRPPWVRNAGETLVVVDVYDSQFQDLPEFFGGVRSFMLPDQGTRVLKSAGTGEIRRGWIGVQSDSDTVSGLLTYRNAQSGIEVAVEPTQLGTEFVLFVEETSEIGTGVAIFKPAHGVRLAIEVQIRDETGADPVGEILRWGGSWTQRAQTLPEWFEGVDQEFLKDFRGLLFLRAAGSNFKFAPLGLRFGKRKPSLSAVPAIPLRDLSSGKMYWAERDRIRRANLDGSGDEYLVTSGLDRLDVLALDPGAGKMYWTDSGTDKIQRANLDGSGVEDLVTSGLDRPQVLVLNPSARKMYWADGGTDKIQRANLDGSRLEDLVTGAGGVESLALDLSGGKMYWTAATEKIRRANLDGSRLEDLVTSEFLRLSGLALDLGAGKMYWTNLRGKIQRANLDGSAVEDLVTLGLDRPAGLALDPGAGKMYWVDWGTGRIGGANLDGSEVETLVYGGHPFSLVLDLGVRKMYWTSRSAINRMNLNRSGMERLVFVGAPVASLVLDLNGAP
ncbi:MAG: hypothetical protein OXT71_03885 [Acidobacteriota bacterium]|nr:hypothetical protein [Acidobacteriota bacterium]